MDLESEDIIGFEALARWRHPEMGDIPPDRFIPIAEDCGLLDELSEYLLDRACRDARMWPESITLSFNISPVQLRSKTLGLRIVSTLANTGLLPSRLQIELTETALIRDIETAKEVIDSLRAAGVRVALDDFGTGYSSLYHLRNFKFDTIKIDRSFVSAMQSEAESAAIVNALTGLGNGLRLVITAEGVETRQQQKALLARGCRQGQGFLFSAAVPFEETETLLRTNCKMEGDPSHTEAQAVSGVLI